VIPEVDQIGPAEAVKRVVICTGKVYYDLLAERRDKGVEDVAIVRLEQIYPFPMKSLASIVKIYPNAEIIWCQEEPENMGAWNFVDRKIERMLGTAGHRCPRPVYVGRDAAASPATGLAKVHAAQQAALVARALLLD
jgi:2-oxoglutarate dehydrogenase E1 component